MLKWIGALTPLGRIVGLAIVIILAVVAFLFVRDLFVGGLETEAELGANQGQAAIESGKDAVGTVSDQNKREEDRARSVDELEDRLDEANTVDDAHDAGADWLCTSFSICGER